MYIKAYLDLGDCTQVCTLSCVLLHSVSIEQYSFAGLNHWHLAKQPTSSHRTMSFFQTFSTLNFGTVTQLIATLKKKKKSSVQKKFHEIVNVPS